jgi:hypothetical protein
MEETPPTVMKSLEEMATSSYETTGKNAGSSRAITGRNTANGHETTGRNGGHVVNRKSAHQYFSYRKICSLQYFLEY